MKLTSKQLRRLIREEVRLHMKRRNESREKGQGRVGGGQHWAEEEEDELDEVEEQNPGMEVNNMGTADANRKVSSIPAG